MSSRASSRGSEGSVGSGGGEGKGRGGRDGEAESRSGSWERGRGSESRSGSRGQSRGRRRRSLSRPRRRHTPRRRSLSPDRPRYRRQTKQFSLHLGDAKVTISTTTASKISKTCRLKVKQGEGSVKVKGDERDEPILKNVLDYEMGFKDKRTMRSMLRRPVSAYKFAVALKLSSAVELILESIDGESLDGFISCIKDEEDMDLVQGLVHFIVRKNHHPCRPEDCWELGDVEEDEDKWEIVKDHFLKAEKRRAGLQLHPLLGDFEEKEGGKVLRKWLLRLFPSREECGWCELKFVAAAEALCELSRWECNVATALTRALVEAAASLGALKAKAKKERVLRSLHRVAVALVERLRRETDGLSKEEKGQLLWASEVAAACLGLDLVEKPEELLEKVVAIVEDTAYDDHGKSILHHIARQTEHFDVDDHPNMATLLNRISDYV